MAKMSESKPTKPKKEPASEPASAGAGRRVLLNLGAICVLIAAGAVGLYYLKSYVRDRLVFPDAPPAVVLVNRPAWMSDHLAERIAAAVRPPVSRSALDHQMLVDVTEMLRHDPWVKQVRQVRRVYGKQPGDTLEIDCEYNVPIALVKWRDVFYLVDNNAVLLPEQYTSKQLPLVVYGQDKTVNIRIVTGVKCPKPADAGQKWNGDDLIAGLELAKYLYGLPYANEIEQIDVSNFQGRVDAKESQLVLVTRHDTQVRWGRPINDKDYFIEVRPERKLAYLQTFYRQKGRVDAGLPWIDVRFDQPTGPRQSGPAQANGGY